MSKQIITNDNKIREVEGEIVTNPNGIIKRKSNNPSGRPSKEYSITNWFQEMFKQNPDIKDKIGKTIIRKAIQGDILAIKLVWSYMDGLPQIKADLTSDGQSLKGLIRLD